MRKQLAVSIIAVSGLALGGLFLADSVAAEKHGPPPQPLHQEADGHWTPYEIPKETPSGSDIVVYTIQQGDWLSKIAQQHLGDWKLWPQIWEQNLWIKDSHWIYPGDKILIKGGKPTTDVGAAKGSGTGDEGAAGAKTGAAGDGTAEGDLESASLVGEPILIGTEDDIYCFGYIDEKNEPFPRQILAAEDMNFRYSYSEGDIVFVDGGLLDGVKAGDEFFVVDRTEEIRRPSDQAKLGRWVNYYGRLKVLCVQEKSATAEIVSSCDSVRIGMGLLPFQPIPVPIARKTPAKKRCDPTSGKVSGEILRVKDDIISFGADHVVAIDLGTGNGVKPGDFLTVYSPSPNDLIPRTTLGELGILTAGEKSATAKILDANQDLWIGLKVELK